MTPAESSPADQPVTPDGACRAGPQHLWPTASISCSTRAVVRLVPGRRPHTASDYLDMFTFFASSALGMNHPALRRRPAFRAELAAGRGRTSPATPTSTPCRWHGSSTRSSACSATRAAAPVLRRRRRAGRRERAEGGVRLEEPRSTRPTASTPRSAPGCCTCAGVPRPQRLHAVADQHRSRSRSPGSRSSTGRASTPRTSGPAPTSDAAWRPSRCARRAAPSRPPARHRLLHRRADPGRGRRPPLPA